MKKNLYIIIICIIFAAASVLVGCAYARSAKVRVNYTSPKGTVIEWNSDYQGCCDSVSVKH